MSKVSGNKYSRKLKVKWRKRPESINERGLSGEISGNIWRF